MCKCTQHISFRKLKIEYAGNICIFVYFSLLLNGHSGQWYRNEWVRIPVSTAFTFGQMPLRERYELPYPLSAMGLIVTLLSFYEDGYDIKQSIKVDTPLKREGVVCFCCFFIHLFIYLFISVLIDR